MPIDSSAPATPAVTIRIQAEDFCLGTELAQLRARQGARVGAVASFVGLVRDSGLTDPADPVQELFLEHYPGMTEDSLAQLVERAQARWALLDVVVVHRIGALAPSAQIVLVQVAAAHRPDAFAACEFLMDYLKTDAVIWKRERNAQGARWLEPSADDHRRRQKW